MESGERRGGTAADGRGTERRGGAPATAGLAPLIEAIDGLLASDPVSLADPLSVTEAYRQLDRLEACVARLTAAFDAARGFEPDRAQNAATWLAVRCRVPKARARKAVRLGRVVRDHLPACGEAWANGEIGADHVATIASVRRRETEKALERDEQLLVDNGRRLRFDQFVRTVRYWEQHADPDGTDDDEERRRNRRDVTLSESFRGMWFGRMTLDPLSGSIVSETLAKIEKEFFEADWASAKDRLGRDPKIGDLVRTPAQRRADALVEMAVRARTAPRDGRRPAPLFTALVGYETLRGRICELASGTVLTPGALLPWLDGALIERAVFGPGARVEVGHRVRLFSGATRRAVEVRDRECAERFCDRPGPECQVDHVLPYPEGGLTTQDNGQLLCGYHNRLKQTRPPP